MWEGKWVGREKGGCGWGEVAVGGVREGLVNRPTMIGCSGAVGCFWV